MVVCTLSNLCRILCGVATSCSVDCPGCPAIARPSYSQSHCDTLSGSPRKPATFLSLLGMGKPTLPHAAGCHVSWATKLLRIVLGYNRRKLAAGAECIHRARRIHAAKRSGKGLRYRHHAALRVDRTLFYFP